MENQANMSIFLRYRGGVRPERLPSGGVPMGF